MEHPTVPEAFITSTGRPMMKKLKHLFSMSWYFVFVAVLFSFTSTPVNAFLMSSPPAKTIHPVGRFSGTTINSAIAGIDFADTTITIAQAIKPAQLQDYAPAALSLFNNMKLPAGVLTAGMISIGFATRFPELPRDTPEKIYPENIRNRCAQLDRFHIVLALISVTSELIVVLWSAVEVNQLTERTFDPAYSVWDLIQRDCDLPWSGINSHFILGIVGFVTMLGLRAYVMLLSANASRSLMIAASTGTTAALCLCISIVNRGVETGGGGIDRYGSTIIDLIIHYAGLLLKSGLGLLETTTSPGPLQISAFGLEIISLCFLFVVFVNENDAEYYEENKNKDDSCDFASISAIMIDDNEEIDIQSISAKELEKMKTCLYLEEERRRLKDPLIIEGDEEEQKRLDDSDGGGSVAVV